MKMPVRKVKHFQILGRAFRTLKDRVYSPNRFLRRFKQKPTSNNVPQFIRGAKKREGWRFKLCANSVVRARSRSILKVRQHRSSVNESEWKNKRNNLGQLTKQLFTRIDYPVGLSRSLLLPRNLLSRLSFPPLLLRACESSVRIAKLAEETHTRLCFFQSASRHSIPQKWPTRTCTPWSWRRPSVDEGLSPRDGS